MEYIHPMECKLDTTNLIICTQQHHQNMQKKKILPHAYTVMFIIKIPVQQKCAEIIILCYMHVHVQYMHILLYYVGTCTVRAHVHCTLYLCTPRVKYCMQFHTCMQTCTVCICILNVYATAYIYNCTSWRRQLSALSTAVSEGGSMALSRKAAAAPSLSILICSTSSSSGVRSISGSW